MATALITHDAAARHRTPDGHPERSARHGAVMAALDGFELIREPAPEAPREALLRGHKAAYVDRILAAEPEAGFAQIDGDTWMSPGSTEAASRAVGGAIRAVDMVLDGDAGNAFCAMRPPGHHAESDKAMGFCLFGSIALAAKHALEVRGLDRVAVVDFDVHHGNGTQDLLWDEPRALFVSSHQMPLWPGSGHPDERGAHDTILNVPLPPESGGAVMRQAYEAQAFPRLRAARPQLLLISAGFDAHQDDPLAQLAWSVDDFAWLTRRLTALAADLGAPVVSVLEGGYDLDALAASTAAHVQALQEAAS